MRENIEEIYLWVEKYRPKILEDLVIPSEYFKIFNEWISKKDLPHSLFYGPPGSGKTTLARILVKIIPESKSDVLFLNGSSTTSIEAVRGLIEDFSISPRLSKSPKICFIDEFEYMSQNAQAALRNVMEKYYENCRFLLTCNYLYKVIDPLQSRCQCFEFKKLPMDYVNNFITKILEKEEITYDKESVNRIIGLYYPDIRKIINSIQSRVHNNSISEDLKNLDNEEKKIRSYISDIIVDVMDGNNVKVTKKIQMIIKLLGEVSLDYSILYEEIFFDENVPMWCKPVINDYYNKQENNCASSSMNFMACVFSIIKVGQQFRSAKIK